MRCAPTPGRNGTPSRWRDCRLETRWATRVARWPIDSAAVVVAVAVKTGPSCGSTPRTGDPIRTGTGHSDRASRWKQLLVAVDEAIAALDVRLGREPPSTLTGLLETAPATRSRRAVEACRTSVAKSARAGQAPRDDSGHDEAVAIWSSRLAGSEEELVPDWLDDLALESVVPPSNWLPSRAQQLADARLTLRRRFGLMKEKPARASHHLRDFGGAHPFFGGSRIVSGDEIEEDLEAAIPTVNPPIAQGWMVALGAVAFIVALIGISGLWAGGTSREGSTAGLVTLVAVIGWLGLVMLVAWLQHVIELELDGVRIRRWTDGWLRRPGIRLGQPEMVRATLTSPLRLRLESDLGAASVSLRLWPHSARQELVEEMPIWGVDFDFAHHRHRPDRHRRRRPHRR